MEPQTVAGSRKQLKLYGLLNHIHNPCSLPFRPVCTTLPCVIDLWQMVKLGRQQDRRRFLVRGASFFCGLCNAVVLEICGFVAGVEVCCCPLAFSSSEMNWRVQQPCTCSSSYRPRCWWWPRLSTLQQDSSGPTVGSEGSFNVPCHCWCRRCIYARKPTPLLHDTHKLSFGQLVPYV